MNSRFVHLAIFYSGFLIRTSSLENLAKYVILYTLLGFHECYHVRIQPN